MKTLAGMNPLASMNPLGGIVVAALALGASAVHAADPPGWVERMTLCSRESDRNARLDCHDRIAGELPGAPRQVEGAQNESTTEVQHEAHADQAEEAASVASATEFGVRGGALARGREAGALGSHQLIASGRSSAVTRIR